MNGIPDWAANLTPTTPPALVAKPPVEPLQESDDSREPLTIAGVVFPRIASQRIRNMGSEQRAAWDEARLRCKQDPLYLANILNFDMQDRPHGRLFAEFLPMSKQNPPVDFSKLDEVVKKRMVLWPRGLFKTSAVIVSIVQTIINYPNVRILFLTGSDILAKRQLKRVKSMFERPTPEFLRLFPEFIFMSRQNRRTKVWEDVQDALGTQHEFTVPCRTNDIFAEPTFAISTADSVKAGSHFEMIYIDDLVNETNYRSAKALETCYQNYVDVLPLLEPSGYILVTGTRYSFDDAYERIQAQAKNSSVWRFSVKSCWSSNCKNCGCADLYHDYHVNILNPPCIKCGEACPGFQSDGTTGTLFPPAVTRTGRAIGHSVEFLYSQKAELGDASFANQYENQPIASSEQVFTETMLGRQTIFDPKRLPGFGAAFTFVLGDLAYSASNADNRDLSVIYTVQRYQGQLFVVDCAAGHFSSAQLVDTTIKLLLEKRPNTLYFEKPVGPADALLNLILARAAQVGLQKVPIQWIPAGNQKGAKATRIANIQAMVESKRLWLYGNMPGYQELVDQLCRWPRTKHDDYCDALARVCEVGSAGLAADTPQTRPDNWLNRLHNAEPAEENYPDGPCGTGICC